MFKKLDYLQRCTRSWTLNDRVNQHYFARVRLDEAPLRLCLHWKRDDHSPKQLVGAYELNLRQLLDGGFVRRAPAQTVQNDEIILRFQREGRKIQLAVNRHSPALDIGNI
jgi:DNA recombination-dependent growth factor C